MSNLLPSTQASDIISYVRSRCRLGSTPPNAIFQTTQMLVALNDINEWFNYWPIDHGSCAPWKYSRKEKLYLPKNATTLSVAAVAGDTTLTLTSGSDFDSPSSDAAGGYVTHSDWIHQFFTYESRSSNTLSGVSTIDIAIASGEDVHKIYTLPSDFGRPRICKVNGQEFKFSDSEASDLPSHGYFFTKYMVSTSGYDNFYLILPESVTAGTTAKMQYIKRPKIISAGTDKVDAPDGVARWGLIKKFESYCWFHRGESALAQEAAAEAENLLRSFSSSQSSEDANPDQGPSFALDSEI